MYYKDLWFLVVWASESHFYFFISMWKPLQVTCANIFELVVTCCNLQDYYS